ncbi:MAG TPA: SurA N-terminal domain-containing protein [Dehalococcoidia bacterium]
MPKRRVETAYRLPVGGRQAQRRRERRVQLLAVALGLFAIAAALVIVGVAYYDTYVKPRGQTVARVGDTSFTAGYFAKRLAISLGPFATADQASLVQVLADLTLEDMVREELARQGAPELGISITRDEVEQEIADRVGVSREDREAFDRAYRRDLEQSGLSLDQYWALAEARLYQDRIREHLRSQLPEQAPQVHVRLIEVGSEEEARRAIERLDAGEEFAVVAQELSTHTSRASGGDAGWLVRETQDPAFEEAAFSLPVGARSGPVALADGHYWVFQVLEREDARPLTDQQRDELLEARVDAWYQQQEERVGVERLLTEEKLRWAVRQALG